MFIEKIKSEGISHLSYMIGSQGEAAVIDPRRDTKIYHELARQNAVQIKYIFETHRNEDYVIGSCQLSKETNAHIFHGEALDFEYGETTGENDHYDIGQLRIRVLETPGHTFESLSYVLYDTSFSEEQAVGVFTGDTLFIGDVGRTDFYPEQKEKVAGLPYDSIFKKILPLGDAVLLYPAHGAGSVCGAGLANREFSTLGYEKQHNPRLQMDRSSFIDFKVNEHHYQPPYFKKMEALNLSGAKILPPTQAPEVVTAEKLENYTKDSEWQVIDIRSAEAFAGAHIPGALALPLSMVPAFGGWFLSYDKSLAVICENPSHIETLNTYLQRMGYSQIKAFLGGGMSTWETRGLDFESTPGISVHTLKSWQKESRPHTLLDVRSQNEYTSIHVPQSQHVYLGHLPEQLETIPRHQPVITFCGSGQRALIAASLLQRSGFEQVFVCLGSLKAWKQAGYATQK